MGDHLEGRFFSDDVPLRRGPRQSGQSAADAHVATSARNMAAFRMLGSLTMIRLTEAVRRYLHGIDSVSRSSLSTQLTIMSFTCSPLDSR